MELKLCIRQLNLSGTKYNEEGYQDLAIEVIHAMEFREIKNFLISHGLIWPKSESLLPTEIVCEKNEVEENE